MTSERKKRFFADRSWKATADLECVADIFDIGCDHNSRTLEPDNVNVHRAAAKINASKSRAARGSVCNVLLSRVTVDTLTHRVLGPTHKRYRQEAMQSNLDLTTAISQRNHPFLRLQDLVRN